MITVFATKCGANEKRKHHGNERCTSTELTHAYYDRCDKLSSQQSILPENKLFKFERKLYTNSMVLFWLRPQIRN